MPFVTITLLNLFREYKIFSESIMNMTQGVRDNALDSNRANALVSK